MRLMSTAASGLIRLRSYLRAAAAAAATLRPAIVCAPLRAQLVRRINHLQVGRKLRNSSRRIGSQ